MESAQVLVFAFLIGVVAGLRSMTAPAVTCWAAHLGWLKLHGTPLSFMGSAVAVGIFTVLGCAELVADQLPSTPARTQPPGLIARFLLGGLAAAALAASGSQSLVLGGLLGATGGIAGAFAGYQARTRFVKALRVPDFVIAVLEDALAIGGGLFLVSRHL
jgi:uncharacterized membrane protein